MNAYAPLFDLHRPAVPRPAAVPTVTIGGLPIAVLDRAEAAELMLTAAADHRRGDRPLYFTSANGEVIARVHADPEIGDLFRCADQIVADGQPMVIASRWLTQRRLPERVATTDLFHDVARRAEKTGQTFYMLGASPSENTEAAAAVRAAYPRLKLVGNCHGYLAGAELDAKLSEINRLAPDILWLAMGVPREQIFVRDHAAKLPRVGLIKTSGGLFNFLSGTNPRAPGWMQRTGLEWAFRLLLEPKRLAWRYLTTNPMAAYLMLTRSH
ncbi:MAG: WecB/TagA/CpsF family glycosyltransferase [Hyphomicrobiales bacterium]|nr:WecB/TagA/CpsF family glycosyltransferase [Hyphomicrobiales bacterium]